MTELAGLALALASAVVLNWGFFAQHGAARDLPPLSIRRPLASIASLFRDLHWLLGFLAGLGGWLLYLAALALAPLSLVQSTSAGGIAVLALLVHRRGDPVSRREWRGVAVSAAGLVLLGVSLAGGTVAAHAPHPAQLAAWLIGCAAVAAVSAAGGAVLAAGAGLGIAAGMLYAAGDITTKAVTFGGGWVWLIPLLLAAHGIGFALLQHMRGLAAPFGTLVAPVRPTLKERYPLISIGDYASWRRPEGSHVDPWIRTHERAGGQIIRPAEDAMVIEGSRDEWEAWTGLEFPGEGDYVVPGALAPVRFAGGRGTYREPCVWIEHRI